MCSLWGKDFRKMLDGKIRDLYTDQLRSKYNKIPEKEVKYFVEENRPGLNLVVLSKAEDFWNSREEGPDASTASLTRKPYIPDLIEKFDTIEAEIQTPYEEKTIKPEKRPVTYFINDGQGLVKGDFLVNDERYGPLFVTDPLQSDNAATRIFRYLEGVMSFNYGKDMENFGYGDIWLSPDQIILLKKLDDPRMNSKEIDCEDMHNYGAACLHVAGVPDFRYRCVAGEDSPGVGGHLTLFFLEDSLGKWRNMEFTPEYTNWKTIKIKHLPEFGNPKNSMHGKNILFSYNRNQIFRTFNALPTKNDFRGFLENMKDVNFPEEMFSIK